jgi:hypothetical protein
MNSITKEAREYYAGEEAGEAIKATALLIKSPVAKVLGSLFLGINKPKVLLKLYTSEKEAIEWLKGFIE